jgi:hypothetical protein
MLRERHKQDKCEAESIEALHRGGRARSSVEAVVMAAEQRGSVIQLPISDQLFNLTGGVLERSKTIWCISIWFE